MTKQDYLKAVAVTEQIADLTEILISLRDSTFTLSCPNYSHEEMCELVDVAEVRNFLIIDVETKIADLEAKFAAI